MEDLTGMPFTQSRGVSDTPGGEGVRAVDAGALRHAGEGRARREGEREAVGVVRWALCEVRLFLSLLTLSPLLTFSYNLMIVSRPIAAMRKSHSSLTYLAH